MCGPPAIAIAAAAVSAIGAGVGALQANAMQRGRARVAERNAALERENFALEQEATRRDALNHYRRVAQLKGEQRLAAASGGVSTDFGTAADLVTDTTMLAREDAGALYGMGHQRLRGIDRRVANYIAEANAARSAARGALVKGAFDVAGSVLGGVSQARSLSPNYGAASSELSSTGRMYNWSYG